MNRTINHPTAGSVLGRWHDAIVERFSKDPFPTEKKASTPPAGRDELTWAALQQLDERRLERVVTGYFAAVGFGATSAGGCAHLYRRGETQPFGLAQWMAPVPEVGVGAVHALQAAMAAEGLSEGYIVTTGAFTAEARAIEAGRAVLLLDGHEFVTRFNRLPRPSRAAILAAVIEPPAANAAA